MSAFKTLGRYEIIKELGRGGMGIVLKGRDPMIDRMVALKIIRLDDIGDTQREKELLERFYIEARAAGKLAHPNIITIYDIGEEEGKSFLAMEFIEGRDLADTLAETGAMELKRAAPIIEQIADGLAFAHERGIVHRDIKPGNILLHGHDRVKITDFGLARLASAGSVTQTGHAVGSPSYMSPEQVQGLPVDGRSDIFSLGVMFYEMVTGRRPFEGESLTNIIFKIIKEEPVPPSDLNPLLPPGVDAIIGRMTAKEPGSRYQSCREIVADIKKLMASDGFLGLTDSDAIRTMDFDRGAVTVDLKQAAARKPSKGSALAGGALLAVIMMAGAGWYYYDNWIRKPLPSPAPAPQRALSPQKEKSPLAAKAPEKPTPPPPPKPAETGAKAEAPAPAPKPVEEQPAPEPVKEAKIAAPPPPKPVDVIINVEAPAPGETFVDGEKAGAAPGKIKMALNAGEHTVEVRAKGYSPWTEKINVKDGGQVKIIAAPQPAPGSLRVETSPENAEIWIDGKKAGSAPLLMADLAPGRHSLKAAGKGYEDAERSFTISPDSPTSLEIKLQKTVTGSLAVSSTPAGAEVFLDGDRLGVTPSTWKVNKGEREITLRKSGYKPRVEKVKVEPGETAAIAAALEEIGRAVIVVAATPWADVYLNGEKAGATPPALELAAPEGEVEIRLVNPGFRPHVETRSVGSGERIEIFHAFSESESISAFSGAGTLKIIGGGEPGMVFVDGKAHGRTPIEITGLPVGEHNIVVKRRGLPDYKRKVRVEEGITSRIEVPAPPPLRRPPLP